MMRRLLLSLVLLVGLWAQPVDAAVAKNAGDSGTPNTHTAFGAATTSLNNAGYTVGAGSDVVLIAILTLATNPVADTSNHAVTWAGVSMTQVGTGVYNDARVCIFYKVNPATGNQTAAATWTGASDAVLGLISFTGAGTPIDAVTNTGSTDPITLSSVTSDANGASLAAGAQRGNIVNLNGSPTTPTALYADITNWAGTGVGYIIGGTGNSYEWPVAAGNWAAMGIHIPEASAPPPSTTPRLLLLGVN